MPNLIEIASIRFGIFTYGRFMKVVSSLLIAEFAKQK